MINGLPNRELPGVQFDLRKVSTPDTTIDWRAETHRVDIKRAQVQFKAGSVEPAAMLKSFASSGSIASMIILGWAFSKGEGVSRNRDEAERWYRRAVDSGSVSASCYLATYYLNNGELDQARHWYAYGAERGFTPSMFKLGLIYSQGEGTEDVEKALDLWERAALLGHVYAIRSVVFAMLRGRYGLWNVVKGVIWYFRTMLYALSGLVRNPHSDLLRCS
jgi:TPR repeat protein